MTALKMKKRTRKSFRRLLVRQNTNRCSVRLKQALANYGTQAICGPLSFVSWPAKLKEIIDRKIDR